MNWNLCFIASGILWSIEMLPQILTTYKTKNVEGINILFPAICLISFSIFFVGCAGIKNWILFGSHVIPFLCILVWLIMILIYRRK